MYHRRGSPIVDAMTDQRSLTKSASDRKLCGVAGGIAEHYVIDPTLVRLGFVFAAFCGGLGIVLYLVACVLMAPEDRPTPVYEPHAQAASDDAVDARRNT